MTSAYRAGSRLALMLDLERVLLALADDLDPDEPPVLLAWSPGALAERVADGLLSPAAAGPVPNVVTIEGRTLAEDVARRLGSSDA